MKYLLIITLILLILAGYAATKSNGNQANANTQKVTDSSVSFAAEHNDSTEKIKDENNLLIAGDNYKKAEVVIDPSKWKGVNLPLVVNADSKKVLTQADFDYAAAAGANVIRLAIRTDPNSKTSINLDKNSQFVTNGLAALDKAVQMAKKAGLKLILDMHTTVGTNNGEIWNNEMYWQKLSDAWEIIAKQYKGNETVVAFDLMNEPNIIHAIGKGGGDARQMFKGTWKVPDNWKGTPKDYFEQIKMVIQNIRKEDPDRYVVVEGFGYLGNPINFNWMKPIESVDKVIYSFHMYVPTGLTMLGTNGSKQKGNDEKVQPFNLAEGEAAIDKAFAPVIAFQKKYNVPVYVGEFGITDPAVFGKDANGQAYNGACWLSTVVAKMNQHNWGWTYWDFWTDKRKPNSKDDPRYVILSAAMKGKPIPNYCK